MPVSQEGLTKQQDRHAVSSTRRQDKASWPSLQQLYNDWSAVLKKHTGHAERGLRCSRLDTQQVVIFRLGVYRGCKLDSKQCA